MQFYPAKQLSTLIKHYLFVESNAKGIKKFRLFSDGNTGIVFSFKNKLITSSSQTGLTDSLPVSFAYGQISGFKNIFCVDETSLLIVVFKPYALSNLLNIPANELVEQTIDLTDLFGNIATEVTERLFLCQNLAERIQMLESFFIKIIANVNNPATPMITASVNFIQQNNGLINQEQLIRYTGCEQRQIERKFIETIGITPKKYCDIVKLTVYLKYLRDSKPAKLSNLAYESGYYDQAHVTRYFKKITGVTPTQYSLKFDALALNLLEFPNL
ncbi:DUF6597 domain-containing transcriptional factor [Pedobacter sp. WC2423]|uniref:DUF6597 domain-containing transcriptional factor n=1 Tax=Pedobacter sp. WC2423 TaxID=3234142 RepID=UPI0034650017